MTTLPPQPTVAGNPRCRPPVGAGQDGAPYSRESRIRTDAPARKAGEPCVLAPLISSKRLGLETLETRELLSGVTAVLDHGVLTVTGASDSSSEIHVWRQANRIRVDGVGGSFAATQVRSIRVACGQNGDQTVDLGIGWARGQTALAGP